MCGSIKARTGEGGFSLIEVMVAMTILSAGIVGVVGAFSTANRAGAAAQRREQAALLAERELTLAVHRLDDDLEPLAGEEGRYTWRIEFETRTDALAVATIDVRWQAMGRPEAFVLQRVFPRR